MKRGDYYEVVDEERLWRADLIEALLRTAPAEVADAVLAHVMHPGFPGGRT